MTACDSIQAEDKNLTKEKIVSGDNYGELHDQGKLRTYYFYTPKSYHPDRPMPLVLVFHGDDSNGRSISNVTRFNELAEQKGFIVVYPDGIDQRWSLRGNAQGRVDDVLFVNTLIEHLQKQINIDSHKIYATGFSRGGILTQALACKLSDKIAGFASVAGSLPVRLKPNCQPQTPISMLMINGTNDRDVLYEGDDHTQRGALVSISDMVEFWRSHDKCTSSKKSPQFSEDKVKTSLYTGCNSNSEVWQLAVINGGHFWPGGSSTDESLNKFNSKLGLNASETIWNFFQRHSLS
ncbi:MULTISPECIES: alpha/beta hydrolase family esterase [unclassified Nostoc]|uniref:extracellular catalytic domain type 1 short-chain-length polyhydroxyalkanoate depolymerase n=1 Tax=unclassified Nostoc TaxID=2593658 RepID=UPI002AD3AF8C|nr:PHB depolymerase family esterase [Nostoc sp. DedQUE03]MDZ7972913.1 PHB depolymerase family esterase [Nostoc sp. DedQUE03]MDZ8044228.1 PHB depolymerase family esterase [Nostoc sp. DedQUE02]